MPDRMGRELEVRETWWIGQFQTPNPASASQVLGLDMCHHAQLKEMDVFSKNTYYFAVVFDIKYLYVARLASNSLASCLSLPSTSMAYI